MAGQATGAAGGSEVMHTRGCSLLGITSGRARTGHNAWSNVAARSALLSCAAGLNRQTISVGDGVCELLSDKLRVHDKHQHALWCQQLQQRVERAPGHRRALRSTEYAATGGDCELTALSAAPVILPPRLQQQPIAVHNGWRDESRIRIGAHALGPAVGHIYQVLQTAVGRRSTCAWLTSSVSIAWFTEAASPGPLSRCAASIERYPVPQPMFRNDMPGAKASAWRADEAAVSSSWPAPPAQRHTWRARTGGPGHG